MWFHRAVTIALALAVLAPQAVASDSAVPPSDGVLHGFHAAADVACAACHRQTPPEHDPGFASCVNCHGTMLGNGTAAPPDGPDPHRSPHLGTGETPECTTCHHIHRPSDVTCAMCHRAFEFEIR